MLIGLLVAAPIGPVNVLCIQRAIERGFWGGLAAGLGAVIGDALIAFCAAMGVGAVAGAIQTHRTTIQVIGGIVLIVFGIRLALAPPQIGAIDTSAEGRVRLLDYAWDIPKTFFLTITNPGAVLGLFAIFGGVSTFVDIKTTGEALLMVASVAAGSLAWWAGLSQFISRVRHRLDPSYLMHADRVAGLVLLGFGVLLLAQIAVKSAVRLY